MTLWKTVGLVVLAALLGCAAQTESSSWDRAAAGAVQDPPENPADDEIKKEKVVIGTGELAEEFELELAADALSRERGMMFREEIDEHGGMLFVYPGEGFRSFWMKNCVIDLEIIFLDEKGKIVQMHLMKAQPRREGEQMWRYEDRLKRYESRRMAQYAIEVKPGTIKRTGVRVGQTIELDFERLTKLAKENAERDGWG